jgi:hypothetical protein
MSVERLGKHLPDFSDEPERWVSNGGSAIIAPNGAYLVEPVFDAEMILYQELDFACIDDANWMFDGVGHHTRPDVFELKWDAAQITACLIEISTPALPDILGQNAEMATECGCEIAWEVEPAGIGHLGDILAFFFKHASGFFHTEEVQQFAPCATI